ncbi:DUF4124 domain-containing protein [Algibacillus agarilyticus]|uniref:DUF4124 domain-containing protein n=1 Tax=Algibacillus agarilyticus TaxID=2234133 RepID=UPI00130059B8|nr:DUF4124 domain-containing protein [Algibacillus agarilyticus]
MTLHRPYLLSVVLFLSFLAHAEIYKWVDENGVVHFSQQAPTEVHNTEAITVREPNISKPEVVVQTEISGSAHKKKISKKSNQSQKSKDECWSRGNSYGFLIAYAEESMFGKEKADYIAMMTAKKRALEKECGDNSNAWQ